MLVSTNFHNVLTRKFNLKSTNQMQTYFNVYITLYICTKEGYHQYD